jgi:hypothetical protein
MRCWLRTCTEPGEELIVGAYRIVLCLQHRVLLESTSGLSYGLADPPPPGEGVRDAYGNDWWPWEFVPGLKKKVGP